MTVAELIDVLKKMPQDAIVCHYEPIVEVWHDDDTNRVYMEAS